MKISIREAAEIMNCAEVTVRGYVAEGKLNSEKIGHAVLLNRAEVEKMAQARRILKFGVANELVTEPEPAEATP